MELSSWYRSFLVHGIQFIPVSRDVDASQRAERSRKKED
ncbi:hypothetical protein BRADI_3g33493v3 [Brachypodium distachyon]|uniref:Uncharacterized protein n=1 Tax=Brachypodium distachyon TaxID=15368 RepID=A0A2K2D0U7_BRADI|nr:hypothetical protein BRADI_3g33493v3 [Brachypodium distachyon]